MKTKTIYLLAALLILASAVTVTFSIAPSSACDEPFSEASTPRCDRDDDVCGDPHNAVDDLPCDLKDEGQDASSCDVGDNNCGEANTDCGEANTDCGEANTDCDEANTDCDEANTDCEPDPPCQPGCGTPGYWKNHPEAWPVDEITIGGTTYTRDEAIAIMKTSAGGDKTYTLFMHLVAAKLNVEIGNDDSCVADTITEADAWMEEHPVGSGVKGSSEAWDIGEPLKDVLDAYNNGLLCAPKRE